MMLGAQKIFLTFPYTKQKPEYLLYIPAFLIFSFQLSLHLSQVNILLDQLIDFDILTIDLFGVSGQDDLIQFSLTLNTFFDFFHFCCVFRSFYSSYIPQSFCAFTRFFAVHLFVESILLRWRQWLPLRKAPAIPEV